MSFRIWTWSAALAALTVTGLAPWIAIRADEPNGEELEQKGEEILTKGFIHEAWGKPVTFDPQAGMLVKAKPPDPIEELPPEQKPEGDNVAWISGYFAWDEDNERFIWISGFYRELPPDREWVPGYWHKEEQGYRWVSGFWRASAQKGTEYLPPPPDSLEIGPSTKAPSEDYFWSSGYWTYWTDRYVWRPGCWLQYRPGWVYVPAHYVWTPGGCVFVGDYWDVSLRRRGVLLAPAYIDPILCAQPGYIWRPRVVIDCDIVTSHLFAHPRYHHYCFGDYYRRDYLTAGIYPWFSFHLSRGYCPSYAYYDSYYRRHDPKWHRRIEDDYRFRRDNVRARPPVTFVQQQTILNNPKIDNADRERIRISRPLAEVAADKNTRFKFERLEGKRRDEIRERSREVREVADRRVKVEREAAAKRPTDPKEARPVALELPRSPIAGRPSRDFPKDQAPPPLPEARRPGEELRPIRAPDRPRFEDRVRPDDRARPNDRSRPDDRRDNPLNVAPPDLRRPTDRPRPVEPPRNFTPNRPGEDRRPIEDRRLPARPTETPRPVEPPRPINDLRRIEPPRPVRPVDRERPIETPRPPTRPESPRRIETPQPPARPIESPRRIEPPRPSVPRIETPRPIKQPRVNPTPPPRRIEQPARLPAPKVEPRAPARPAAPAPRANRPTPAPKVNPPAPRANPGPARSPAPKMSPPPPKRSAAPQRSNAPQRGKPDRGGGRPGRK